MIYYILANDVLYIGYILMYYISVYNDVLYIEHNKNKLKNKKQFKA